MTCVCKQITPKRVRVFSQATAFRPCQYSKWATCPGSAKPTGGGLGLGRVLQPGTFLADSLFPVAWLAASVGNRHQPKVIGSVDIEQGEWELCQPKLLDPRYNLIAGCQELSRHREVVPHPGRWQAWMACHKRAAGPAGRQSFVAPVEWRLARLCGLEGVTLRNPL